MLENRCGMWVMRAVAALIASLMMTAAVSAQPCSMQWALQRAKERPDDMVGQGWRSPRQYPWHLGHVHGAMSACRVTKGPKWHELEKRAAAYRHPMLTGTQLLEDGRQALLQDRLRVGMECQCAMAIDAFGPRGYDLDGVLAPRE